MKYIDLSKLQTSPYSAITNVVALDENGDIIKAENINIENELTDYTTREEVNATLEDYATIERMENDFQVFGEFVDMAMPTPQPTGTTATTESKKYVYNGSKNTNTTVVRDVILNHRSAANYQLAIRHWGNSPAASLLNFEMANSTSAGMMTADMYNKLMSAPSGDTATKVVWGESSNINTYTTAGVYDISGERRNANDNLPILNSNPGHTISARLYVLDSSISGNGASDDKCITQVLMLSNRVGGDGNLYVRTGRGSSISNISWEQWGTLQQNINVGTITSYDNLIDNGIYSGVFTNGSTIFDTFVMVVINNYAVAGQVGATRSITQMKFVLKIDGNISQEQRIGTGDESVSWGVWRIFNYPKSLNSNAIGNLKNVLLGGIEEFRVDYNDLKSYIDSITTENTIWHWIAKCASATEGQDSCFIRIYSITPNNWYPIATIFIQGWNGWCYLKFRVSTEVVISRINEITSLT